MKYLIIMLLSFGSQTQESSWLSNDNVLPASEWELTKNEKGVKVYTRTSKGMKIKEFKAITVVKATMESLVALIDNVNDYPNWQANVSTASILEQVNPNEQYIYYSTDIPWPATDRDIVLRSIKTIQDSGIIMYTLTSSSKFPSSKDNFLRIKEARGKWLLTPKADGEIEVMYQFYGDPAGNLPNWLINMFVVSGPFETLVNLKVKVKN